MVVHTTSVLALTAYQVAQTLYSVDRCSGPWCGTARRWILPPALPVGRPLLPGVVVAREPRVSFTKPRILQSPLDYSVYPIGPLSRAATRGQTLDSDLRVGAISFPLLHSDPSDS